jgi:hypothetical protein
VPLEVSFNRVPQFEQVTSDVGGVGGVTAWPHFGQAEGSD